MLVAVLSCSSVLPVPTSLVSLDSAEGRAMAARQPAESALWATLAHFQTQVTQSFCSVATSATMLNALNVSAPTDPIYSPYPYFTQANMLGSCALDKPSHRDDTPLSARFIATHGATLGEWHEYLRCHARAERTHASESTLEEFRMRARGALEATPPMAVGLNFHRSGKQMPQSATTEMEWFLAHGVVIACRHQVLEKLGGGT
jgi:hypothetical protein